MSLYVQTEPNWLNNMVDTVYRALPVIIPIAAAAFVGLLGYHCYKGNDAACQLGCAVLKTMRRM
jgi:hypothetical protein